ncbi:MAG: sulfatase-like hydrolase/transferase [Steroidobacteraceae bacterium]|nr:sulfatase-like hydrolase/transferase [Steroidobacteraceae bacterium]
MSTPPPSRVTACGLTQRPDRAAWLARLRALAPWIVAALGAYALLNAATIWPRITHLWGISPLRAIGFLVLFAVAGVSFTALLISLNRYLLIIAIPVLVAVLTTNGVARETLDLTIVNQQTAEWLLWEIGQATDAVSMFAGSFAAHLALSVLLLTPVVLVARAARQRFRANIRDIPLLLSAAFVYASSGVVIHHYFTPYIPAESNLLLYGAEMLLQPSPDVPPADMQPGDTSPVEQIVLVIDESVTYDAYVTHLQNHYARWNGVDFGEAASLSNCSAAANSMLRWGFRAEHMLAGEDPRLAPTIWSYAHAAGFKTWLIDGQRDGSYQNFMRRKEAKLIDHLVGVDEGVYTDDAIARLLSDILAKPGKRIIYVNKRGSHFPYAQYPQEKFPGARTPEQHYARSVQHSSQRFLDLMLQGVSLRRTLVLYTSDHGEQFGEGSPHCNVKPRWQESSVPLVLLTESPLVSEPARAAAAALKNRAGHGQLFATMLFAMGYDLSTAEREYGTSLLSPHVPQHYYFVSGNPIPSERQQITVTQFTHFPHRAPQPTAVASAN